jgi:hypothetical protein
MKPEALTRREFLKRSSTAALAGALFLGSHEGVFAESEKKTRVVLIRNKDVLGKDGVPREGVLGDMLDEALTALFDESDPNKAWQQIVGPEDVVGIKTNVWSHLRTPTQLESALEKRVIGVGVQKENIAVSDRGVLGNEVFKNATALINTRPLRTHHWSGVGSLLKNYIMFVEQPSAYHGDSCADLATIWKLPIVKDKTRLNVLVLLTPLFHSVGPHDYSAKYTWDYKGLLVGTDPVAVDATGVRLLVEKRRRYFEEVRPINPPPKHVLLADERHHLGTADPERIDLVKLGWEQDVLI